MCFTLQQNSRRPGNAHMEYLAAGLHGAFAAVCSQCGCANKDKAKDSHKTGCALQDSCGSSPHESVPHCSHFHFTQSKIAPPFETLSVGYKSVVTKRKLKTAIAFYALPRICLRSASATAGEGIRRHFILRAWCNQKQTCEVAKQKYSARSTLNQHSCFLVFFKFQTLNQAQFYEAIAAS